MSDGEWFPRWFWWPFYVIGAPIFAAKWIGRQLKRLIP